MAHGAKDSYLSQVIKLVKDAQNAKSNTQLLADKAAQWLMGIAILAGVATFISWYVDGKVLAFDMERMVTVIVICCPHALELAVPLVVAKSTSLSAKNGLLIKNRTAFEDSRKVTMLFFDKTGTLTIGKFEVSKVEVTKVTFTCAMTHVLSTVLIGLILAFLGAKLDSNIAHFTSIIAPIILIAIGLIFIYRHHRHRHFHINEDVKRERTKTSIITALVVAMFFSPCLEIEAYFLLAGTQAAWLIWFIALMYLSVTTAGMVLLVRYAYKGLLKLNWHSLEHNAGIITGPTLVITGIITFFIQ